METETPTNFSYMGRNFSDLSIDDSSSAFSDLSIDDSSSAFSDCNSDSSGEFQTASSQSRRFLIACASDNSDDLIRQLVGVLETGSIEEQKQAAMEIRLLAKNKSENRLKIAKSGAIRPLISLLSSSDLQLQEYGVTAILNLSLCDENKELITSSGAIKPLVRALKTGTPTAKENVACALLRLSQIEENKVAIGRSGALPLLVNLLENGGIRGKKDASTALYSLCSVKENKIRAVQAGIMKPLVELMADFGSNMVDKSAYVLSVLVSVPEARTALVEECGIPVLVEIVEVGSQRQKEMSVAILLQLCENNAVHCNMVAREGAIPPLVALSKSGTNRAKQKSAILLQLCKNNAVHRDMVAREGAIPPLVALSQLSQSGTNRVKRAKQKFRQNFGSNVMLSSSKMESLPGSLDTVDSFQVMKDANVEQMLGQVAEEHETLPHHLKRLFMYCSLFPFDYEFSKDELIQLWIAEGFIRERQMERMEDTASEYFNSLEKEGFFVYSRCDFAMEFDSLVWASANNPDNFLYKVNPIKRSLLEDTISSGIYFKAVDGKFDGASEMTRHLSLIDEDIDRMAFGVLQNFKHLRTLHMLSSHRSGSIMKQVPRDLCFTLTFLRTLNLSGTWISELPSSIGNVKSLRYVDASHTRIARLPESIDTLHNLQTIKLRDCTHFVELPKGMKKLTNLRHIDLDIIRQLDSMPAHLGNLTNLQTLSAFLVGRDDGCHVGELKNLNDLKGGLNISRLENVASKKEAEEAALIGKKCLHTLEFRWSDVFVEYAEQEEEILECLQPHYGLKVLHIHQYSGSVLPTWISNPAFADLVAITLYKCRNCKLLPCMGQLPALKCLFIIEMNEVKYIDHQFLRNGSGECAFPKLERLEVDIMLNLKEWKHIQVGDFPSLVKLIVDSCPELVRLAPLACLQSLKHLELRRCPKLLTLPSDGRLPHSLDSFLLVDCFELKEWCLKSEHWSTLCHISSIWFDHEEVGGEGN